MHADIRLRDLKERERRGGRLMNVKIPAYVSDAIEKVAHHLGASKTEVVIALLNEGLEASAAALKGWHPPKLDVSSAQPASRGGRLLSARAGHKRVLRRTVSSSEKKHGRDQ